MKKFILLTPVVLLVVAIGAFLYLRAAYPPERLVEILEPRVEAALGREVEIRRAELTPFPLAVRLENVQVRSATGFADERALLDLAALRCELQWLPLLRREIAIRALVIEQPRVFLERNAEGRWNYESSLVSPPGRPERSGTATATPLGLSIETLRVQSGSLEIRDAVADVTLQLPFEAELGVRSDRSLRDVRVDGWLQSDAVSGGDSGRLQALRGVRVRLQPRLRVDVADSSAVVEALRVELEGLALELEGQLGLQNGAPVVHLRTRSNEFELAEILGLIPRDQFPAMQQIDATGKAKLALQADREAGQPMRMSGSMTLTDGSVSHPEWPAPVGGIHAEIEWADQLVMISKLEARVADSPLRVSGQIQQPLNAEEASYELAIEAALDLEKIVPMLSPPPDVRVQGHLGAGVRARGALRAGAQPHVTGPVKLQDVRVESVQLAQPLEINATLEATGDVVQIQKGTIQAGEARVVVEGELRLALPPALPSLKLRGSATRLDLDALQAPEGTRGGVAATAAADSSRGLLPVLPPVHLDVALRADELVVQEASLHAVRARLRGDGERFDLELHGERFEHESMRFQQVDATLEGTSASASGGLRAQDGKLGKLEVETLQSDLVVQGTRIELPNLEGKAYGGRLEGQVAVDVSDPDSPRQDIQLRVEEAQLGNLMSDLWSVGNVVAGSVSGSTQLLLQGRDPQAIRRTMSAEGEGIAVNGRLREMPLFTELSNWVQVPQLKNMNYRELGFDFEIKSGRVRFPRLQLMGQDAVVAVLGSVGLDGDLDLDLNVRLSEASTKSALQGPLATRVGSLFTDADGRLLLDFDVRGTLKAPRLTPNFQRTAARRGVQALDKQALRRLLGGLVGELGNPQGEDTVGKKLENAVQDGVKDAVGGLFGKKKRSTPPDSTPKP